MIGAGSERLGGSGAFGSEDERQEVNPVESQEAPVEAEGKKLSDAEMAQLVEDEPGLRRGFGEFLRKNKIEKDNPRIKSLYRGWLAQHKVRRNDGSGKEELKYSNELMNEMVQRYASDAPLIEQSIPEEVVSEEVVSSEPEMNASDMAELVPYGRQETMISVNEVTPQTVKQLAESGVLDIAVAIANNPELGREFRDRINTVVEMDDINSEDVGEQARNSLRARFMRLPIARKIVTGVAAVASVAVIATGIFAAAKSAFGSGEVKAATTEEADLGAVEPVLNGVTVDVSPSEAAPIVEETPSLWEDESLYQGNINLANKDLLALGSESYQDFAEEYPNMVEDKYGAVADYTDYESDTKDSPNAVNTSIEAYHDDVDGMKKAILEINKKNPQALAFAVASMPEFLKQVGGMDEALAISDAGERAAYISKMMTSEGGGDLQKRLYAGFELAVNNVNTTGGFETISGPQWSSYIAPIEEMDHNTISNLVPGMSEVQRENDPHFNLSMKFDKLDDDGNVVGNVTYKLAYREVCANIDVIRVVYTEDGKEEEVVVFTIKVTPPPTQTEETKEEETKEETEEEVAVKDAEHTVSVVEGAGNPAIVVEGVVNEGDVTGEEGYIPPEDNADKKLSNAESDGEDGEKADAKANEEQKNQTNVVSKSDQDALKATFGIN